jgi:hypothetical protein
MYLKTKITFHKTKISKPLIIIQKTAFCPKEVKRIIESEALKQKNNKKIPRGQ